MNQECKIKEGKSVSQDYSLLFLMPALKLKVERKDKALRRYQPLIDAEELDRQSYSAYHHLLTLTFLQLLRFRLTTLLKRKKER